MINLDEIDREIHDLEARGDTTYSLCERLAWLYIVRDHLNPPTDSADNLVRFMGNSEFLELCNGINYNDFMQIIDTHMEALKVVCPKEYNAVIDKIRQLHVRA